MTFDITLSGTPLELDLEREDLQMNFLRATGVIPYRSSGGEEPGSIPQYQIFKDFLLRGGGDVKEMSSAMGTTLATIYRHLKKFEYLDIIEYIDVEKKHIARIRYDSLPVAWKFTELHVNTLAEMYIGIASAVDKYMEEEYSVDYKKREGGKSLGVPKEFGLRLNSEIQELWELVRENGVTSDNIKPVLMEMLKSLGMVSEKGSLDGGEKSGIKIVKDCLLRYPDKEWAVDEFASHMDLSVPTIYRLITKAANADMLVTEEKDGKKYYQIKWAGFGNMWSMIRDYHIRYVMDRYRECIEHMEEEREKEEEELKDITAKI